MFGLSLVLVSKGGRSISPLIEVLGASASTQSTPAPATFQQILHNYRSSRADDAVSELAAWPVDQLVVAARAATPKLSSPDRMAAAILQAEVVKTLLVVHRVNESRVIVVSAQHLLDDVGRAPFGEKLGDEPRRSWYYAMASSVTAYGRLADASSLVNIGLKEFHDDPLLVLAGGTISEHHVYGRFDVLSADSSGRTEALMQWEAKAITDYKRAIALRPDLAIAKLRLGHMYLELGREREASPWLESVAAGAATDNQLYLAHLLLGRIAANAHQLQTADAEYQKALSIGAGYQAACIALSQIEEMLGHHEQAAERAEDCLRISGHDDPWRYFRAKDDPDALPHLRAEARER